MTRPHPVSEHDLHAWADGELAPARRAEVEAWLAAHPEEQATVDAWLDDKAALQRAFAPLLAEPVPGALRQIVESHPYAGDRALRSASMPYWQRLVAGVAIAVVAGSAGWVAHGQYMAGTPPLLASLPRQAAMAHVVYAADVRRPVEVAQEAQLVTWLSKRLGAPMRAPHLEDAGFSLIGGRLLPGDAGPVAQFMYQDGSGQRLTLYVTRGPAGKGDTAFRFAREGDLGVFYWVDRDWGYALSSGAPKATLSRLASVVYDQLQAPPP